MRPEHLALLRAWEIHDRFGEGLTEKYRKALAQVPPRFPKIGPYEGSHEANRLVATEAAFAAVYDLTPLEVSRLRSAGRRDGLSREQVLESIANRVSA